MKKSAPTVWLLWTSAAILLWCCSDGSPAIGAEQRIPTPEYTVSESLPSDPPEVKQLLGKWAGNWDGKMDSILVITEIDIAQKRAKVIYAWSDAPAWGTEKGYIQVVAEYVPGEKPMITWGGAGRRQFDFTLKNGKLEGSMSRNWSSAGNAGTDRIWVTMVKAP
jgi:hypothetical protein